MRHGMGAWRYVHGEDPDQTAHAQLGQDLRCSHMGNYWFSHEVPLL